MYWLYIIKKEKGPVQKFLDYSYLLFKKMIINLFVHLLSRVDAGIYSEQKIQMQRLYKKNTHGIIKGFVPHSLLRDTGKGLKNASLP